MAKEKQAVKCGRYDCCLQSSYFRGNCGALQEGYRWGKECPFYKKHINDINRLKRSERKKVVLDKKSADRNSEIIELKQLKDWVANKYPLIWKELSRLIELAERSGDARYVLHYPDDVPENHEPVLLYTSEGEMIGYYLGSDEDGGNYYEKDYVVPLINNNIFVYGWRHLMPGPEEED